jgi:REP element-mobilizing transposase RayT
MKKRRSIRVSGFDYAEVGDYFVTIVTYHRLPIFGHILNGEMHSSELGKIATEEWFKTAQVRRNVMLLENEFVLMPNHIHGIIHIIEKDSSLSDLNEAPVGAQRRCAPTYVKDPHKFKVVPGSLVRLSRV